MANQAYGWDHQVGKWKRDTKAFTRWKYPLEYIGGRYLPSEVRSARAYKPGSYARKANAHIL
ncbi:MAG: hypothetical protein HRU12_05900 [Phaeodactylibacter sp.]|nr:hypothetical protein [Phaeodactylibacter sp.]